ncbi:hypothetical protein ACSBR1_035324 [Camellia fascicularis]
MPTSIILGGNETDHLAMLSMKAQITHDPMLVTSSWNDSLHFCQWEGVSCGRRHQRVISLNLASRNLEGSISPSIGNLSFLRIVNLSNNSFQGEIPCEMGRLFRLQVLDLNGNLFGGQIPASLSNCSNLRVLRLSNNKLIGNLPKDAFTQLVQLHMSSNNLLGSIPPSFGNLSTLKLFLAQKNLLEGSILDSLGSLKSLTYVSLSANKLTGTIPPSIYNISSLIAFEAPNNLLEGSLPQNLGFTLPNIKRLNLWGNQLSGSIPVSISNASKLEHLDLSLNNFSPRVAVNFGNLMNFSWLSLFTAGLGTGDANDLDFISTLANCSKFSVIELQENNFGGVLPNSLANFSTKLQYLTVVKNKIFGSIPADIGNLVSLNALDLHYNQLTRSIPNSIGKLDKLQQLGFGKNKLSGEIPSSIANLTLLTKLWLEENHFQGNIPSSLGNFLGLIELHLNGNNLSGSIPREVIGLSSLSISLDLSGNRLTSPIPLEVGNLRNLVELNLSYNKLSGNNKLCGGIPTLKLQSYASKNARKLIIPIVCGVLGIIFALSVLLLCWLRKMRKQSIVTSCLMDSSMDMSYRELFKATNGFSSDNLIGSGSFGLVYKGILHPNEKAIAVKLLDQENRGASRSFIAECKTLGNIRHRNLVKIINACASVDFQGNDFKALIYEFMENGSLESWLHPTPQTSVAHKQPRSLNLFQRLNIAIDVASALDYLHNHCDNTIIHCDIKPSNILFDSDMTAHVGDFGLARLLLQPNNELSKSQTSFVGIRGTTGYAAPEYGMGSVVSTSGDVYSYGILLLELFTGKRPTDGIFKDGLNLHKLAKIALPEKVMENVDQKLVSTIEKEETTSINSRTQMGRGKSHECLTLMLKIGVACSEESPQERITIVDAIKGLHLAKDMLLGRRISSNVQIASRDN